MKTLDGRSSCILAVNAGSSSIKLALFNATDVNEQYLHVSVVNIGDEAATLYSELGSVPVSAPDHATALALLMDWLTNTAKLSPDAIIGVGHRVVHGGPAYSAPQRVSAPLLTDLERFIAFDPEHLPVELQLIRTMGALLPGAQHVACFDTAFHHALPARAQLLPIPRRFAADGVRRYGFHGLSYSYILTELQRVEGEAAARGKVIVAHLGSGVSLAAIQNGQPVDTTMSMTPASGVPMSARAGDLDPGLVLYMQQTYGYDAERFNHMINFESGLLGISETTHDMKKLLDLEEHDQRAREAVDIFCYNVRKQIGSFAAALGGLNTLVFTGGMGEQAPKIRQRICEDLEFLGIRLDDAQNQADGRLISAAGSLVGVHVIPTDEATTIARQTIDLIPHKER